jgi:short-subunit dehydrogenase
MNTAAHRMVVAAGAPSGQGMALGSDLALEGLDRPVAAERSFDVAAEPVEHANGFTNAGIDDGIELIQTICRDMRAHGEACILLAGSASEFLPARYHPAYTGGRANINSFSWVLRDELKDTGITAICVVPGMADADYFERADEPVARIAADVSDVWNKLQAAMTAFVVWSASLVGFERT